MGHSPPLYWRVTDPVDVAMVLLGGFLAVGTDGEQAEPRPSAVRRGEPEGPGDGLTGPCPEAAPGMP